jgi:hypothetical protein
MHKINTENIYKYLQPGKIKRIYKIFALFRKLGGFEKYWRFPENQADLQNIGALQKNRRTIESWRVLKSPRLVKTSGTGKSWQPAYCLGSAESPAADFLLDWLKSSRSDPCRYVTSLSCRPQVRERLRLPCFYGRTLSRTVPAACTGLTCQNPRGNQNFRRPREFSPIPVKSQKS